MALVEAAHTLAHVAQPRKAALERLELLEPAGEPAHQPVVDLRQPGGQLLGDAVRVQRLR